MIRIQWFSVSCFGIFLGTLALAFTKGLGGTKSSGNVFAMFSFAVKQVRQQVKQKEKVYPRF
jgi:hypothetical protein